VNDFWARFNQILSQPVTAWSRLGLALSTVLLVLAFASPLWHIHMVAPQYREGLDLYVYAYSIESGNDGQDLKEINNLDHYIEMQEINRAELADLDWIPFALGALVLLALRVAVIGDVRALVDLAVTTVYFGVFSAGRFVFKLYTYGHNLDPTAPLSVEPFMPPVLGTQPVANFVITSLPSGATFLLTAFAAVTGSLALWHLARPLVRGRGSTDSIA
jgi:hypothetical protein